ncbi:MAG: WcaI family glycosyltransferase [Pseudomonadota bacterium]|nr:WcaI family glycosyltransferase [Pseudomonadota bacterium]
MRLLIVSLNFSPELTATGKYTGEMAGWFAARGHEVDAIAGMPHYPEWVIARGYRGRAWHEERLGGVRVLRAPHFVPRPGRVSAFGRILMECSFTLASLRWWLPILLQRRRYDAVIAVCPPMQDALLPWFYGLLRRVPWVYHIQDFQVDAAVRLGMLRIGRLGRLLFALENFFVAKASRTSTITPPMRDRVLKKGGAAHRSWLVPNWADIASVRPTVRDNAFRRERGWTDDQVIVMYAGAMGAKQGLEIVVDLAVRVQERDDIHFVMVGAGAERLRLEGAARDLQLRNMTFLPVQPLERLSEMLGAADIHLIVQRAEAADLVMPSKLTNILAAGRPCVATAEPGTGLHEVLSAHRCGLAVTPESVDALVAAVVSLSDDAASRQRMGIRARRYAEENLDRDAILERMERDLEELCPPKSRESADASASS